MPNAKEFAELNAGTKWLLRGGRSNTNYVATIIGYLNEGSEYLVVLPDDEKLANEVTGHTITELYPEIKIYDNKTAAGKHYWSMAMYCIEQVIEIPAKHLIPYPNRCKSCKSNGRKIDSGFLCSNAKCKSRRTINRTYKVGKIVMPDTTTRLSNGQQYFLDAWKNGGCVVCGGIARDGLQWAHGECWNYRLKESEVRYELTQVMNAETKNAKST